MTKFLKFGESANANYATTREYGDIPGCVPAVDVFVEYTDEEAREHVISSADHYTNAVRHFIDGGFPGTGNARELAMWEEAFRFKKLSFIKNATVPYFNKYDK